MPMPTVTEGMVGLPTPTPTPTPIVIGEIKSFFFRRDVGAADADADADDK